MSAPARPPGARVDRIEAAAAAAAPPPPPPAAGGGAAAAGEGAGAPAARSTGDHPPLTLESHPQFVEGLVPFLDLRSVQALCGASPSVAATVRCSAGPHSIAVHKPTQPLDAAPASSCFKVFRRWGGQLQALSVSGAGRERPPPPPPASCPPPTSYATTPPSP
jgi:hypothetical protein